MIATLSADRATIHMRKGAWSMSCPVADLPHWLAFYREMRDRKDGRAEFYRADVVALERVEKMLRIMGAAA